ncbi:hypothetical protein CHF27_012660 [Romboutsia maritimum]|uniref:Uncharacterized protein n=1 Tax=Romboutsia maritimum TaxID=2020948 RepID=A0A371IQ10_9FIRM|nr:hypothetical protein [Romboutsia maritimum]RDY22569.1 hypothetical protein CHF27_012660 [Romboutsia maritimum]
MRMYSRSNKRKKGTESNIPNILAFTLIRNFLIDRDYEDMRREYFIKNLSTSQVNQAMKDLKWLFKTYKGLDAVTIEDSKGKLTKFTL